MSQSKASRPLSPHLTIYRQTLTMMMSIAHRISGGALYFGMLLVAWWLMAAAGSANGYGRFQAFIGSWFGCLLLLGFSWALLLHALGGIRHLIWDLGYGFGPGEREWLARATLVGSIVLAVVIWIVGFILVGRS